MWPGVFVEDGNIGKVIHTLRSALADRGGDGVYIETVPKHGYRFVADVTRIESNAAAAVVREVGVPSRSPAYDLYIRGKVKADSENVEDADKAIALLETAVGLDPTCAGAFAQLAKALDLNPNLAEAHFARGLILWTQAKGFPHAIRAFKKALALEPDADETHHQLSMVYSHVGLLDDALGVLKTVPSDVSPFLVDRVRAEVYVQLGRLDKAGSIIDAHLAEHPTDAGGSLTSVKALLLAKTGERRAAARAIARAIELGKGFGVSGRRPDMGYILTRALLWFSSDCAWNGDAHRSGDAGLIVELREPLDGLRPQHGCVARD